MVTEIILIMTSIIIASFAVSILSGAPYLPTKKKSIDTALNLARVKEGITIYDLGCGTGGVLIAAGRLGANAVGFEINPLLWSIAYLRTLRYPKIKVRLGSFWDANLTIPDVVFVFGINRMMGRLETKLASEAKELLVVSYIFELPNYKSKIQKDNVFLYRF